MHEHLLIDARNADTLLPQVQPSRYAQLGASFVCAIDPAALPDPYWVGHSQRLAQDMGLDESWKSSPQWLAYLSGNQGSPECQPSASVYSGHQFGVWAGQLGDGRACSMGELGGLEVQLKGAGPTPFSRRGDGRAVLRSSIREFLCSEAMHALGIPTTRALSVTGSDAPVWREKRETAAVVARVAPSFVRFGHFEHFSHGQQIAELKKLADFVIDQFYPRCRESTAATPWASNPYAAMLAAVTQRTAEMVAHWQSVGFCHGVMNTDNMSILGLTLDYGPFQFLDAYNPTHICNHSDTQGRYAFYKQPNVAYWNLYCLGQALLPLIEEQEQAIGALETFKTHYPDALAQRMGAKLGFVDVQEPQRVLIESALQLMGKERVDFTIFWRRLSHWAANMDLQDESVEDLFVNRSAAREWLDSFQLLHRQTNSNSPVSVSQRMLSVNPKYVLRNHLGELAIRAAKTKDFSVLQQLQTVLEDPFSEHPAHAAWAGFAPDWAASIEISCSS